MTLRENGGTVKTQPVDESVRVLFFSVLREKSGVREMDVAVDGPTTSVALIAALAARVPEIAEFEGSIRVAVNGLYADVDMVIRPGDEVAIITPVSGG